MSVSRPRSVASIGAREAAHRRTREALRQVKANKGNREERAVSISHSLSRRGFRRSLSEGRE